LIPTGTHMRSWWCQELHPAKIATMHLRTPASCGHVQAYV